MAEEQVQNQKDSTAINILGALLPVVYLLLFIYQMVESFMQGF